MTDFMHLKMAETRLNSLTQYHPNSGEQLRMKSVVQDMLKALTKDQLAEYETSKIQIESAEDKRKRLREEIKQMELTRDSNSI